MVIGVINREPERKPYAKRNPVGALSTLPLSRTGASSPPSATVLGGLSFLKALDTAHEACTVPPSQDVWRPDQKVRLSVP